VFRVILALTACAMLCYPVTGARADWPERSITLIVPFAAGGTTDLIGRMLASELSVKLGQAVKVDNRVGDAGNVGLSAAAQAAPTGYTLVVTTNAVLINPILNPGLLKLAYDPLRDFSPIAFLGVAPNVIVTRPGSGIQTIGELIAKAKANPGKLSYASPGRGTSSQLAIELLKYRAGVDIAYMSIDGASSAVMSALSGATDVASFSIAGMMDYIRSGHLVVLAQTGAERWSGLPDVPTLAEAGIPNAVAETSQMFLAPAYTPPSIIENLARTTGAILQRPDLRERMLQAGFLVDYEGPDALRARMASEYQAWRELAQRIQQSPKTR
jgi:tripartite-type tricarboxylate transporter receptor subunit TctC